MGPPRSKRAGPWPVQLRQHTTLTSEQYVSERGWLHASLKRCPSHPGGGCRFSRHGTYPRVEPPGMEVPRWYCRDAHRTFSLLPDCMSARLTGSLDEAEQVVVKVEESRSVEAAAKKLRPEIEGGRSGPLGSPASARCARQPTDSTDAVARPSGDKGTVGGGAEHPGVGAGFGGVARDRRAASPRFASAARIPPGRNPNVEK